MTAPDRPADPPTSTRSRGLAVEACVAEFLARRGFVVLARNVTIAGAELDLVVRSDEDREPIVVFVEVRSRAAAARGHPLETIDARKRGQIVRGATAFLVAHDLWEKVAVRFDVIAVVAPEGPAPELVWLRGAFETTS